MNTAANSSKYSFLKRQVVWLVAVGLATWVLSRLPLSELTQTLSRLHPSQWLAWIALNLLIIVLLVVRWMVLTRAIALPCRFSQLLRIRQAGSLISFVTPGPQFGGEPLQVYWLWRKFSVPGYAAFLAVGLDRFFELWVNFAVLLLAVLALLTTRSVASTDWSIIALVLLGFITLLGILAWLILQRPLIIRDGVKKLSSRWQNAERLQDLDVQFSKMSEALQAAISSRRRHLVSALAFSLLAWASMIGEFWLLLYFVDLPPDLTTFVFLFVVVRLAFLLPLPGGVGSVEAGLLWAFQSLALPLSAAATLIVLMRLRDVLVLLSGAAVLPGLQRLPSVPQEQ